MSSDKSYLVPAKTVIIEHEVKNSRFITTIGRAAGSEEAKKFVKDVSDKYADATHNCYAFIAGDPGGTTEMGMSDDGEVPGTAAKPMMNILRHSNIGEVVAVVTRYYGGTNLGTGGLVRAYSDSVQLALDKLKLEECFELLSGSLQIPYNHEGNVRHIFDELKVKLSNVVYSENVALEFQVPEGCKDELENRIADLTSGTVRVNWD